MTQRLPAVRPRLRRRGRRCAGARRARGGHPRHRAARAASVLRRAVRVRADDDARGGRSRGARCAPLNFEAYVFTTDRRRRRFGDDLFEDVRPALGVLEDPATGSASGPLGSYLVKHSVVTPEQARSMVNLQGVKLGRPSWIHIAIETSDGAYFARARRRHVGVRRRRHHGSGGLRRAHRIRSAPVRRRHAASCVRKARRASAARSTARRACTSRSGRRTPKQVSVIGDFNGWDPQHASDAESRRQRHLGDVRAGSRRRRALQVRDSSRARRRPAAENRSLRRVLRIRRQRRGHRLGSQSAHLARPGNGWRSGRARTAGSIARCRFTRCTSARGSACPSGAAGR